MFMFELGVAGTYLRTKMDVFLFSWNNMDIV